VLIPASSAGDTQGDFRLVDVPDETATEQELARANAIARTSHMWFGDPSP
jgi:hypothetical protein